MKATCSIEGCERDFWARGVCGMHYKRQRTSGELAPLPVPSPAERLAAGLERKPNGCLEWTKGTDSDGYGSISVNGKMVRTNCLAWTLVNGPIPSGMCVCHKCDNPPCCDVERCLFLGTHAENMADMAAKGRGNNGRAGIRKTHCPSGHPYSPENTSISPKGAQRCLTCGRATVARHKDQKKAYDARRAPLAAAQRRNRRRDAGRA